MTAGPVDAVERQCMSLPCRFGFPRGPAFSPSDLAILSLAVYLVGTAAHEAVHDILRAGGPLRPRLASLTGARSPSVPFRQPVPACIARSASS
jgi:hypothetical protein